MDYGRLGKLKRSVIQTIQQNTLYHFCFLLSCILPTICSEPLLHWLQNKRWSLPREPISIKTNKTLSYRVWIVDDRSFHILHKRLVLSCHNYHPLWISLYHNELSMLDSRQVERVRQEKIRTSQNIFHMLSKINIT